MPTAWNVLNPGLTGPGMTGELTAMCAFGSIGFANLASALNQDHAAWETAPPALAEAIGMTGRDYVQRWLPDLLCAKRVVRAVFGLGVGGVYAAALAERVSRWQEDLPLVVVFDLEQPTSTLLHWRYCNSVDTLSSLLSTEEVVSAKRAGEDAIRDHRGLRELAAALHELFRNSGRTAFERAGLGDTRAAEVVDRFGSFLFYLAAADGINPGQDWSSATMISSSTPGYGLDALPVEDHARAGAREIRFETRHGELLGDEEVRRTVRELLA